MSDAIRQATVDRLRSLPCGSGSASLSDSHGVTWEVRHSVRSNKEGQVRHVYAVARPGSPAGVNDGGGAETSWDRPRIMSVMVRPEQRRRGIATALYRHIESHLGVWLEQNVMTTEDGAAFWSSRNDAE